MSWPIPDLPIPQMPQKVNWLTWLFIFFAVFGISISTIIFFWPRDLAARPLTFWIMVTGVPICLYSFLFGLRLHVWEQAQLNYEESIGENERLMSLWHRWANRDILIVEAICLPGGVESTNEWSDPSYILPVNLGRTRSLEWLEQIPHESRYGTMVALMLSACRSNFLNLVA